MISKINMRLSQTQGKVHVLDFYMTAILYGYNGAEKNPLPCNVAAQCIFVCVVVLV